MNEKEKLSQEIEFKVHNELNLTDFYKEVNDAIITNNMESLYGLSKAFTRYCFKELDL